MIEIGKYNVLKVLRIVSPGAILGDNDSNEVLLPGRYIPNNAKPGDELSVFVYKDSEDRPVATTDQPLVLVGEFGFLKVKDVNAMGAFLEWGMPKDLLVPYREQNGKMEKGKHYMVFLYLDDESNRLVATAKLNKHYDKDLSSLEEGQKVNLLVGQETSMGINVVVENKHQGLVFKNEVFSDLISGDRIQGYVKTIRDDGKLDISLRPIGLAQLDGGMEVIIEELKKAGGYLPVHDKSSPEEIQFEFQLSKKNFKRSLGMLYKKGLVKLEKDGIRLIEK